MPTATSAWRPSALSSRSTRPCSTSQSEPEVEGWKGQRNSLTTIGIPDKVTNRRSRLDIDGSSTRWILKINSNTGDEVRHKNTRAQLVAGPCGERVVTITSAVA